MTIIKNKQTQALFTECEEIYLYNTILILIALLYQKILKCKTLFMFPNVISLSISIWLPTYVSLETTYLVFCQKKKKKKKRTC